MRCPLVVLSRQLVVALPLAVLSLHHPLVNSLIQPLVVTLPLLVILLCPAPPSHPLVAPAACCVASRRSALSSSRRLVVPPLVVLSRQLVVAPSSLVVLSLHRPLILSWCWLVCVACPCAALLSSRRSPLPTPSNAVECCCRHRTPPPPLPLNAVSIVHRCHSCRPSPQSNANAHLCPSPLSNADAHRRHPPSLMSISIVALSLPICSPHRRCR